VAPVSWKGEWYAWTLPVAVRADMPAIEFSGSNARRGTPGSKPGARQQRLQCRARVRPLQWRARTRAPVVPCAGSPLKQAVKRCVHKARGWQRVGRGLRRRSDRSSEASETSRSPSGIGTRSIAYGTTWTRQPSRSDGRDSLPSSPGSRTNSAVPRRDCGVR
jgi:hypothetical protein